MHWVITLEKHLVHAKCAIKFPPWKNANRCNCVATLNNQESFTKDRKLKIEWKVNLRLVMQTKISINFFKHKAFSAIWNVLKARPIVRVGKVCKIKQRCKSNGKWIQGWTKFQMYKGWQEQIKLPTNWLAKITYSCK